MPEPKAPAAAPGRPAPAAARRGSPPTFDVRQPLIVLRSHFWVAAAIALVACTLVAWQQMRQPRLYAASATLLVERGERLDLGERPEFGIGELATLTRLEQLRSAELLARVLASLSPEEQAIMVAGYLEPGQPAGGDLAPQVRSVVRGAVSFGRREGTTLLLVNVTHRDPNAAALLANRFAEHAVRYTFDRSSASNDASLKFLREQAEDLRKKSEAAERALQEYRQRYNLVSLEANQNIIVDNLKAVNASATNSRVARMAIEARLEQAEAVIKRGEDAAQIAAITGAESLGDVSRRIADLRSKRAVLAERYGRRHPTMVENQRGIEALEKVREEEVRTALASLRDLRDKALAEERQLEAQRTQAEKAALELDQIGVEYNILRRTVDTHKASYSQMLARLNDATISAQLRGVSLKISELAPVPGAPFSPSPQKTILVTAALAIAILLGYPFSAEMFFGRVRSSVDVEFHLGAELLGEIGSVRDVKETDRPMLVKAEHDETAAEQFRALYSQLALTSKIDPPKSILITSTMPGEGKSFIAVNLAECFVAHGRKTLLIDADLRRPTQHRNFGLDNKSGLLRWLDAPTALDGELPRDAKLGLVEVMPGLFLLRAGGSTRKASELMESGPLPQLLGVLQRHFDVMILDTPPAGVFPDAAAFARTSHELIYICRFNRVSRHAVREVLHRLRQTGLEFPGVVLNAMPTGFGGAYYYKAYSYQRGKYYSKRYQHREA